MEEVIECCGFIALDSEYLEFGVLGEQPVPVARLQLINLANQFERREWRGRK